MVGFHNNAFYTLKFSLNFYISLDNCKTGIALSCHKLFVNSVKQSLLKYTTGKEHTAKSLKRGGKQHPGRVLKSSNTIIEGIFFSENTSTPA